MCTTNSTGGAAGAAVKGIKSAFQGPVYTDDVFSDGAYDLGELPEVAITASGKKPFPWHVLAVVLGVIAILK